MSGPGKNKEPLPTLVAQAGLRKMSLVDAFGRISGVAPFAPRRRPMGGNVVYHVLFEPFDATAHLTYASFETVRLHAAL